MLLGILALMAVEQEEQEEEHERRYQQLVDAQLELLRERPRRMRKRSEMSKSGWRVGDVARDLRPSAAASCDCAMKPTVNRSCASGSSSEVLSRQSPQC